METIAGWLPEFVNLPGLFAFLIDATLKGIAILTVALLFLRFQEKLSSATAFGVLTAALALCIAAPFLTVWFSRSEFISFTQVDIARSFGLSSTVSVGETGSAAGRIVFPLWATNVIFVWLFGSFLLLLRSLVGHIRMSVFRRKASRVDDSRLIDILENCKEAVGVTNRVRLVTSDCITIPVAFGYFHTTIALPREIIDRSSSGGSDAEIRHIFIHELGHVKRRDNLTGQLAQISLILFWFNPLVWLATKMSDLHRERVCDDYVLSTGADALDYADQLLQYSRRIRSKAFSIQMGAGIVRHSEIGERIRRLSLLADRSIGAVALTPASLKLITVCAFTVLMTLALVHVPVADNIEPPGIITYQVPEYPAGASLSDIDRDVLVKVFVNKDGSVVRANLQQSSGDSLLDATALDAARGYEMLPQKVNGRAVPVWMSFRIQFPANAESKNR